LRVVKAADPNADPDFDQWFNTNIEHQQKYHAVLVWKNVRVTAKTFSVLIIMNRCSCLRAFFLSALESAYALHILEESLTALPAGQRFR